MQMMRAIELHASHPQHPQLVLAERPLPQPGPGQVLVRVAATPINPSDLMFLHGTYGLRKRLPAVPGFECSGRVVAAGRGPLAGALLGRRVACGAPDEGDGAWAEYMATSAARCVPLPPWISLEQGATALVNPLTAWALLDLAQHGGHRAIVQTAAAGALGRMIGQLARRRGLPAIQIVRRAEQAARLRAMGAAHVLVSEQPGFEERLAELCRALGATIAFDAVGGALARPLLRALPPRSRLVVYGELAGAPGCFDPGEILFAGKHIEGFWLADWISDLSFTQRLALGVRVLPLLGGTLRSHVRMRVPLAQAGAALAHYEEQMGAGKVLLMPSQGYVCGA